MIQVKILFSMRYNDYG